MHANKVLFNFFNMVAIKFTVGGLNLVKKQSLLPTKWQLSEINRLSSEREKLHVSLNFSGGARAHPSHIHLVASG
jgi:hypothetical protein